MAQKCLITTSLNASGGIVNQVAETYDGFGQLAGDAQSHSGAVSGSTPTVGYTYDPNNGDRLTSMTYPNGRVLSYNYNGSAGLDSIASRISSVSDGNGNGTIQTYAYQGLDTPVQATSANGIQLNTTFDSLGRISSLTYTNSSGGVIDGFSYTYDADGNVISKTNLAIASLSETYGYDNLHRLTSFARGTLSSGIISSPSISESWNYNALGDWNSETVNGVTTSRTNTAQNQATTIGSATLNYDADGNTLSNQVTGQQYVYDAWNRLVAVKNSSGGTIASYSYDALGRRITQTYGSTTTDLYYSNRGQVIEEQQSGATIAQYVWSPFYVNQLVQETNSHGTFYVQQDANYNVTSLSNSSGSIVERYFYDPYGAVTVLTAAGAVLGNGMASSAYGQIVGDQGGWTDIESGLIHFNARDLDPWTGQWNTQDPTGAAGSGANLYQDLEGNPIDRVDPLGLQTAEGNEDNEDDDAADGGSGWVSWAQRGQDSHDRIMEEEYARETEAKDAQLAQEAAAQQDANDQAAEQQRINDLTNELNHPGPLPLLPGMPATPPTNDSDDNQQYTGPVDPLPTLLKSADELRPYKTDDATGGGINYGALDNLGRPTGVDATITPDMIGTGTPANPQIIPPGWSGNGAVFNEARGHLLGAQLGGSGDIAENLVTLEQNQANSPIMRDFETSVRNAVENGQVVNYSAIPAYNGTNLVPMGITLTGSGTGGFSLNVTVLNPPGQ